MDLEKIKTLIDFVGRSSVAELTVTQNGTTVRITKDRSAVNAETTSSAPPSEQKACAAIDRQPPPEQTARPTDKAVNVVKAPSAGVFHRAPDPAAAPFVEIGTEVTVGQSLCVIEAMKVFNTIPATQSGRIIKIAAADGQDVDFGQPLFEIG